MGVFDNVETARAALNDPHTTAEDLLAITTEQPGLWAGVALHSNAYPELLEYLSQYGDDNVKAAVASRIGKAPGMSAVSNTSAPGTSAISSARAASDISAPNASVPNTPTPDASVPGMSAAPGARAASNASVSGTLVVSGMPMASNTPTPDASAAPGLPEAEVATRVVPSPVATGTRIMPVVPLNPSVGGSARQTGQPQPKASGPGPQVGPSRVGPSQMSAPQSAGDTSGPQTDGMGSHTGKPGQGPHGPEQGPTVLGQKPPVPGQNPAVSGQKPPVPGQKPLVPGQNPPVPGPYDSQPVPEKEDPFASIPDLFVSDVAIYPPAPPPEEPAPQTPAAASVSEGETPVRKRKSHPVLITVGVVILALAAVAALYFFKIHPGQTQDDQVKKDFSAAVDAYNQAQEDLSGAIADAQTALSTANTNADPAVLAHLSSVVNSAQALIAPAPAMASDTDQIKDQITVLQSKTEACRGAVGQVNDATNAAIVSMVGQATDLLTQAIADARDLLTQSKGLVDDESLRADLSDAIDKAQASLDGLPTADPAMVDDTVSLRIALLTNASDAVRDVMKTRCDNDVLVPAGINPIVCQPMPAETLRLGVHTPNRDYMQFSMPSGNVGCTENPYGAGMMCEIINKDWTLPPEVAPPCPASAPVCGSPEAAIMGGVVTSIRHTDVAPWENNRSDPSLDISVLEYGQVEDFSPVACLSDEDGVVCWDTNTHHGFQMNVTRFTYW